MSNPSAKREELMVIQNILYNNGFPLELINNLLKKQKSQKLQNKDDNSAQRQNWATFTIFGNEKHFITKIFRHTTLCITYRTKTPFIVF